MLVALGLLLCCLQPVARADGMSTDPNARPTGTTGPTGPTGGTETWPPAGAEPKGPFVAGAFSGIWYAFIDNTAFTLMIQQQGQILKISHTAIYDYGRRVDSSVGGVSMAGTVNGSLAYLEWKSGLSPENGRATLEYMPGYPVTLHWKIVDSPKKTEEQSGAASSTEVAYFLPAAAFLIRK